MYSQTPGGGHMFSREPQGESRSFIGKKMSDLVSFIIINDVSQYLILPHPLFTIDIKEKTTKKGRIKTLSLQINVGNICITKLLKVNKKAFAQSHMLMKLFSSTPADQHMHNIEIYADI